MRFKDVVLKISLIPGPRGEEGPPGTNGSTGKKGNVGSTGPKGE